MSIKFMVPFNGDRRFIDYYLENKDLIDSIYVGVDENIHANARIKNNLKDRYVEEINNLYNIFHPYGIKIYTVFNDNSTVLKYLSTENIKKIKDFLNQVKIDGVTCYSYAMVEFLKENYPNLEINISVLADCKTHQEFLEIEKLNINSICVKAEMARNFSELEKIKKFKKTNTKTAIVVNQGCYNNCPFWHQHHATAGESYSNDITNFNKILPKYHVDKNYNIKKSLFILPSNIKDYMEVIDIFKIKGREMNSENLFGILSYYFSLTNPLFIKNVNTGPCLADSWAESPQGTESLKFFEKIKNCNFNCQECDYCDKGSY